MTDQVVEAARRKAAERQRETDKARFRVGALPADARDRLHFELARELFTQNDEIGPLDAIKAAREFLNTWDAAEASAARQWPARKVTP